MGEQENKLVQENIVQENKAERIAERRVEETEPVMTAEAKKIRENFHIFGLATLVYAFIYAFCMYKNDAGIAYLLFVIAGIFYVKFCMKHLELTEKKGSLFYVVSMVLLGISTFCTDDARIIFFNKTGVFLLMVTMVLSQLFETKEWGFTKYVLTILQSAFMAVGELFQPVFDAVYYCRNKLGNKGKTILYAALGVVLAVPVFAIVLHLLMSADAVFGNMAEHAISYLNFDNLFGVLFRVALLFFFVYGVLSYLAKRTIKEENVAMKQGNPVLAIPMAGILTALYLVFSVVQILGLFLGKMALPEGYTYARYAREGFFQLLAVSILNLILVLAGMYFFKKSRALKVLLTLMSGCTFIMIASSAMRMVMYIRQYHLTFLRILVLWGLAVLTVLFIGVMIQMYREQFSLFRYSMVVVTVFYLVLSFSHPDYLIAKYNVAKLEEITATEHSYYSGLCADAATVLKPYMDEEEAKRLWYEEDADSVRKFNLSRFVAKRLFEYRK